MSEKRFVIHDSSVKEYVESLENKNTQGKTKRDVKLLNDFLRGEKKEEWELLAITPEDLERYLAESDVKMEENMSRQAWEVSWQASNGI